MLMFGKKRDDNGEKLYRYSIRKYHFGAASVAIAALIFFANGVAKADMAVSPATANTEKVGVAVTGLTEGVPPTEGHSEKSQEVGSEKEAITKKSVDKSALNQALSDLQAEIAKIDNGKLSSLASQISQLTDESKRLLGDENTSEEAVATLVGRVQAMTEQVRQLQSKENGKEVEDNSLNSKQDSISDKDNEKNTPAVKDKIVEDKRTAVLNKKSTELSAGTESKTITVSEESYIVKEGKVKKELPTYTNEGDGVYKLKDELEFIYKTLEKAGADQSKIQATKEAYDKFNEVFSRGETISQEDFEAAVLNLKKSRDIIESVLKDKSSQASVDEMINSQPRSSDEELPSRNRGRTRTTRTVREGNVNYTNSIESFFEDGKKGDSPYDKYTYIFYSRRQVNAIDNADRRVDEARNQIYADVTPTDSGFKWDIYINRSKYDLSDSVAWFTIPNGQNLKRGSVDISWKSATGGYATSPNDGTIAGALRAAGFKNVTEGTPQNSGVDKSGNSTVNKKYYSQDLRSLSHRGGITGQDPYKKHLETPEETRLAEEKFGIIEKSRGKLFYFEPNQDLKTYHLSFETTGNNNINTLAYAVGMKGERTDDDRPSYKSRFLVNQWYARTPGEKDATDSFKFKIAGNGYFKIDLNTVNALFANGYNTVTKTKNGITYINHRDYMNNPLARDSKGNPQVNGVLTYNEVDDMTDYNGIDMTSYGVYYDEAGRLIPNEAPNGQGAKAQAGAKGQQFTLFKEANGTFRTLTREELTFDAIGTPGVHTYFYNRSFNDGSHDRGKFSFVTKPKKPTLTTDLTRQAGKIINIKAGNGTNGFEMRLYKREANGSLTVVNGTNGKPLTATAGADGVATFNNVKIEEADYVVKTVVEGTWIDYDNTRHSTVESDASDRKTATDGVPPTVKLINRTDGNKEVELSDNENNLPMVTVYRGAVLELPLKYYDNATTGKVNISYVNNNGIPRGVWFNKDINANQNVNISETGKTEKAQGEYTVRGRVAANADLGTRIVTLKVSDDSNGNVENGNKKLVKFKVRVVDLEFENRGTEVNATTRADVLGLGENSVDPNNYLRTTDGENVHNDSYFPSGMKFRYLNGDKLSETVSFDKIGKHSVKARAYFPDDPRAKELLTNPNNLTGDTSPVAGRGYLERTIEFNVRPNAPTLTDAQFYGTAGRRPDVTVSGLPTDSQLQNGVSVTVELYQGDRKVASKIVSERNGSTMFSARDFSADLTEGQPVHAVVKVVGNSNSNSYTVNSNNSNRATVTGRVALNNLAEGKKIVQVQDLNRNGVLSEAEKNAIKHAILEANKNGVLQGKSVNDINISATGLITAVVRDNKVAELQIDPKTGVVTRFAHIRDDYDISFPSGSEGKIRPTDPGFEWSADHKSLIYKFDATAGSRDTIINTREILKKLTATPKTNKATGQPSLAVVTGNDKFYGENNQNNYSRDGRTGYFYHNNNGVNMLDIVGPSRYEGNVQVDNTANKLVAVDRRDINNGNIVGTTLGSDTISAANGAQAIPFNNVVKKVNGESLIVKQQLYLMPKYTNNELLADRDTTNADNTNVINVYFVPVDPTKPDVTRSTTNNLSTTSDQANRLAENTSFKNLAKVTDNYDKDDVTNDTSNTVRSKLNMWVKTGNTKTLIVENGVEKTDVITRLKKEVTPATYEVFAKTTDASGNKSHEDKSDGQSLGFFRVGYNLVARQTINVVRGETLTQAELNKLVQVREGNTLQDLPQGATVTAALETASIRSGKEETKTVEATVNFGENRTQKVTLTYKVLNTFPIARTLYDFKNPDTARSGGSSVYYHNGGTIPDGMTWIYKGSDNVEKRGDDFSTALSKDSVGSTSYTFGGKYNYGRFTNSPTTGNLEYTERVVHKVFDITDSNGVTVDKGAALTVNQAEAAVKKVDGSDPLPEGTTYEWVGSTDTNTPGVRTYKVRVTLPASQSGTEAQPAATQAKSSKTINVTVRVKPEQPEVNSTTTDNRILSTDKVLTGRGIAGATVKVTVNNKVLKEVRVQQNSEWSVSLDKGLNSNNVSNLGQIVERDIVKVTQSVDGVESAEKNVTVVLGESKIRSSEPSGSSVFAGTKKLVVEVPHDAGMFYISYKYREKTNPSERDSDIMRELGFKRETIDGPWIPTKPEYGVVTEPSTNGKYSTTVTIDMKEVIKESTNDNERASIIANIKEFGYSSPTKWKSIVVTNQAPTISAVPQGAKKTVEYGTPVNLTTLVTVDDHEDKLDATLGNKVHAEIVSVNDATTTKEVNPNRPGVYRVKYKAVDSQGKESGEVTVTVNVMPPKPTFDNTPVTSTSRTITGTLGGLNANSSNTVVSVALNDGSGRVLTSENNGGVTISGNTWTATLPNDVKLRTTVAKNGETTQPNGLTVTTKIKGATPADDISVVSDNKAVEMGDYSVSPTIAGSKHIDIRVPHDAKRVELRFHNSEENGDKPNSIVLVRSQNGGDWHVDAVRTDHTAVSDANKFVAKIENGVSRTNASENLVRIHLKEIEGGSKLHLKEEVANGSGTSTYGKGLGLRVAYQSEAGQDPVTAGNWMIANISNTSPTLEYKGTEGRSDTTRKVFPSGTSITKEKLAELVTIRDTEDNHTVLEDKPYGNGSLQIMSGLKETPGKATPAGRYTVVLKAVDSQGKESNTLTVHVGVVSTDLKYQPKVKGINVGNSKEITITGSTHQNGESITYTPIEKFTESGKQYVLKTKGPQTAHLTDEAQVFNIEYVEDFDPVKPTEKVPAKKASELTQDEKDKVKEKVQAKNPGKDVTVGADGTATVTDPNTGISHDIPGTELVNQDFTPVTPTEKVPVKDVNNLSKDEQDKVKESVEKVNPGKTVVVEPTGKVTITDPETNVTHNIPRDELLIAYAKGEPEVLGNPEFSGGVNAPDSPIHEVPEFNGGVNGELPEPTELPKVSLIITKWVDENGNELKPADAKAPTVLGEANEAFEHGEIEGYVFVRTETKGDVVTHVFSKASPARPTGDGQQGPATPSADTNPRPDTATPAEVPATQPAEQTSQTVEVPAQLQNEVSETNPSVSQPQAVLPNTGTKADRATGALGVLSLLGAFGLLFAKKKKDDEEEA